MSWRTSYIHTYIHIHKYTYLQKYILTHKVNLGMQSLKYHKTPSLNIYIYRYVKKKKNLKIKKKKKLNINYIKKEEEYKSKCNKRMCACINYTDSFRRRSPLTIHISYRFQIKTVSKPCCFRFHASVTLA